LSKGNAYRLYLPSEGGANAYVRWVVYTSDGKTKTVASNAVIDKNCWNHIVCTYSGSASKIYINGVLDKNLACTGTIRTVADNVLIGLGPNTSFPFLGTIDEVKIYNKALSPEVVAQLFENGLATPVLYYDFNASSGTLVDDGALNNNGTIRNSTGDWITGFKGNALRFDGTNDCVEVPDHTSLKPLNEVSVSVWLNVNAGGTTKYVLYKGTKAYSLYVGNDRLVRWIVYLSSGQKLLYATTPLASGTWSHVVCTYNGAEQKIYINSVQRASQAATGTISHLADNLIIGKQGLTGSWPYAGSMDELRIYGAALSPSEISKLYNNGAGKAARTNAEGFTTSSRHENALIHNSPNPFLEKTEFTIALPQSDQQFLAADLVIYNTAGGMVKNLLHEYYQPGKMVRVSWDGTNNQGNKLAHGVYYYKLSAGEKKAMGSILFSK
jgi:hypothetical protein